MASADSEEATVRTIKIPGQENLLLQCSTPWEISLEAQGYWARTEIIEPCEEQAEWQIQVFHAGTISGQLIFPKERLQELSVQFESAPRPASTKTSTPVPLSQQACPIVDARWTCTVPAEKLDVRLAVGDYIPRYFWDVVVKGDELTDFGTLQLDHGASLAGWISWHEVPADALATEIRLEPKRFGWHRDARERRHLAAMKLKTSPTDRGFFQFLGLLPGDYHLSASMADATAEGVAITLQEILETHLKDPVVLQPPVEFEVFLEPPSDPLGRPWFISVGQMDSSGILNRRVESQESAAGAWSTLDLEPGHYLLSISDLSGSSWVERWLEIVPGMRPVFIEVPVVEIEGLLSIGDTPLQAAVVFGSTQGQEQIKITTDEEGRFKGYLPREGKWPVDLVFEEEGMINQALDPVDVRRRPGQSRAFLELKLPDTRLEGVVVASDKPVPHARMAIIRDGEKKRRDAILLTDAEGEFELLGLSPGILHVHAYYRSGTSPWVEIELREGVEFPRLRLVLEEKIEFSGLIMSPVGPIPGAELAVWPTLHDGSFRLLEKAATGVDGSFIVEIPKGTVRVDLLVMAPGFAHRLLALQIPSQEPLGPQIIQVESSHGTLIVGGINLEQGLPATAELQHRQARFPLDLLIRMLLPKRKITSSTDGFGLLQMEPGEYRLCEDTSSGCQGGFLVPGGELSLGGEDFEGSGEGPPQTSSLLERGL